MAVVCPEGAAAGAKFYVPSDVIVDGAYQCVAISC
jgi:hypothetical protein